MYFTFPLWEIAPGMRINGNSIYRQGELKNTQSMTMGVCAITNLTKFTCHRTGSRGKAQATTTARPHLVHEAYVSPAEFSDFETAYYRNESLCSCNDSNLATSVLTQEQSGNDNEQPPREPDNNVGKQTAGHCAVRYLPSRFEFPSFVTCDWLISDI